MTKIMYIDDDKKCKIVQKFNLMWCFKFSYNIAFHLIGPKPIWSRDESPIKIFTTQMFVDKYGKKIP